MYRGGRQDRSDWTSRRWKERTCWLQSQIVSLRPLLRYVDASPKTLRRTNPLTLASTALVSWCAAHPRCVQLSPSLQAMRDVLCEPVQPPEKSYSGPSASHPGYTPPASRFTASSSHSPASPSLTKPSFSSGVEGEKHKPQTSSASNSQRGNMPTATPSALFVFSASASSRSASPTPASLTFSAEGYALTSHVTLHSDIRTSITGQWRSTEVHGTITTSVMPPTQPFMQTGKESISIVSSGSRAFADAAPPYTGLSGTAMPRSCRKGKPFPISASMLVAWLAFSMLFTSRYIAL
jgi:hypothetical protein